MISGAKKVKLVLFDFDGTLSSGDSNTGFWKDCFARSVRPWLFLPMFLAGCVLRIVSLFSCHKHRVGQIDLLWRESMRMYLTPAMVRDLAPDFIRRHRANRFGWAADQVAAEKAAGNVVICISAGPDFLIEKLVADMGFDAVICSVMDARRPWRYDFLCWGENKVRALADYVHMRGARPKKDNAKTGRVWNGVSVVRAYSDSNADLPMMTLAADRVWINRKTGMRK
jgi:phosphoserine phosphatase